MRNLLLTLLALFLIAGLLLFPSALQFQASMGAVPPGVRLAGTSFESASAGSIASALEETFKEPIAVYYAGQRLILRPQMVGFTIDVPAMISEAQQHNGLPRLVLVFFGDVIHRPMRPVEVPLHYTLNGDALNAWLSDVANRYDRAPAPARAIPARLSIEPGQPGWQLDIPASRDRILAALTNPRARSADLVVHEAAPSQPNLAALQELLQARLAQFPGTGGLFLHDITTGEEVAINAEVAYSAMGTMKVPIVEEAYRTLDHPLSIDAQRLISETITLAGNQSADALLSVIGRGDAAAGVSTLNESLKNLGLKNSFMAAPFDEDLAKPPQVVTEANSRTDINTHPDAYVQTTPKDMGVMLQMLVECSRGGGALLAAYLDQLSQEECQAALELMSKNEPRELIGQGIPASARVGHKQGYSEDTHADVAVIWGPAGPYVLAIFLQRSPSLDWYESATTMEELSQAVWNYYDTVSKLQPQPTPQPK